MNNIYYKHMDIGLDWILTDKYFIDKLSKQIGNKFAAHWKLQEEDLTEEFLEWLDSKNLAVRYAELFYCSPKGNIFVHSDEIEPAHGCKINWVYDQGETYMRWFKLKEGAKIEKHSNTIDGFYYTAQPEDYEFAVQARIGKPTLVNAYELHDVINPSDGPRWAVSIVPYFKNKPKSRLLWNEAIELFSDYFI